MKTAVKNYCLFAVGLALTVLALFLAFAALSAVLNYTHESDAKFAAWLLSPIAIPLFAIGGFMSLLFGKALIK